tara:strand:- start:110 stop:259 length:150 start_codon:yes stop_codon:yes gene_type:complete
MMEYHRGSIIDFETVLRSKTTRNAPGGPLSKNTLIEGEEPSISILNDVY